MENDLRIFGFSGEINTSLAYKKMYATDASIYYEEPTAVVFPKDKNDIVALVKYANAKKQHIIPRASGTSLAGQCVGNGIVMDCSKHMNQLINIDVLNKQVVVQPGLVRDKLNLLIDQYDLWFSPNTSTSNRATIGGMVANNSSGTTSVKYGVTRDKVVEIEMILSDGSIARFGMLSGTQFENKLQENNKEGEIYKELNSILSDENLQKEIEDKFPNKNIHRRNTGYALDELAKFNKFSGEENRINISKLLAGSEGSLGIITEVVLQLDDQVPQESTLLLGHFSTLNESLIAVDQVIQKEVYTCELMDRVILDCAAKHPTAKEDLGHIKGEPAAVLMIELRANKSAVLDLLCKEMEALLTNEGAYHVEYVHSPEDKKIWNIRKSGLGLLSNIPGDEAAVACIEDTAVSVQDLPKYIEAFQEIMASHGQTAVYYAHAGAGELHLRPLLNLKTEAGRHLLKQISYESAMLVKKYNGSLSGEHGDGRVRAPFIKDFFGELIYAQFIRVKNIFDPNHIFNPGKIVFAKELTEDLRFDLKEVEKELEIKSFYRFGENENILQHAERCNGSADCRKSEDFAGGMCPTFHATNEEELTTRGRANLVRTALKEKSKWPLANHNISRAMESCVACKACVVECPSQIDLARLKSEYAYQMRQSGNKKWRDYLFAHPSKMAKLQLTFGVGDFIINNKLSKIIRSAFGISAKRNLPIAKNLNLKNPLKEIGNKKSVKTIILYLDEFVSNYDTQLVEKTIELLGRLNYSLLLYENAISGRALISKGFLKAAKEAAIKNVNDLAKLSENRYEIIGLEPSAILTFKDEYKYLLPKDYLLPLKDLNEKIFLIEDFLIQEIENGNIDPSSFSIDQPKHIIFHGHCHQKALADINKSLMLLNMPKNMSAELIDSGCCGMAGSFGYEKEHESLSIAVAEKRLFKYIRQSKKTDVVSANGMSCRHQIKDGLKIKAVHPIEILLDCLD